METPFWFPRFEMEPTIEQMLNRNKFDKLTYLQKRIVIECHAGMDRWVARRKAA